jgi:hypothetical protein
MSEYTFIGYKTFVVKQHFTIEADSEAEAIEQLWEAESSYGLDEHWLDYQTNKCSACEQPDFYDANDNKIEEPV